MPELPNIVRERLKVSRPVADHPDADVLTAFAERALPESERAVVAEHVARCHDCRDILALSLPATVELVPMVFPVREGWFRAPMLRWGAVAAGVAVLAVAGLLQYEGGRGPISSVAEIRQYETHASESKTAPGGRTDESAKVTPGVTNALAAPASTVPASASGANAVATIASNADARLKKEQVAARNETGMLSTPGTLNLAGPTAGLPLHGPGSRRTAGDSLGGSINRSLPLFGKQAPASAGQVEMQSQVVAANTPDQAPSRAFMDVTVDKAKAPQTTTVEVSAEAPVLETTSAAQASPLTPSASWGISASGGLLRSFDQGRTWANVDVNASFPVASQMVMVVPRSQRSARVSQDTIQGQAAQSQAQSQSESKTLSKAVSPQSAAASAIAIPVFRAISAAGLEVWAGGSAGVLYHSVNGGEQWTRVFPSASGILLTGDITGIAFSDPLHGQVTTSTKELWITVDAGQTWQKQ
jgi:hypothetical protein